MLEDKELCRLMQKALDLLDNVYTIEDIRDLHNEGYLKVWQNNDGFCITKITDYPRKRILEVISVFGNFKEAIKMQPAIIAYAKENDCDVFYTEGRIGWKRVLPRFGWKFMGTRSCLKIDLREV